MFVCLACSATWARFFTSCASGRTWPKPRSDGQNLAWPSVRVSIQTHPYSDRLAVAPPPDERALRGRRVHPSLLLSSWAHGWPSSPPDPDAARLAAEADARTRKAVEDERARLQAERQRPEVERARPRAIGDQERREMPCLSPRPTLVFRFGLAPHRVHLTVCTVDFTVFTVAVTVFLTFIFLNFELENTGCRYR